MTGQRPGGISEPGVIKGDRLVPLRRLGQPHGRSRARAPTALSWLRRIDGGQQFTSA